MVNNLSASVMVDYSQSKPVQPQQITPITEHLSQSHLILKVTANQQTLRAISQQIVLEMDSGAGLCGTWRAKCQKQAYQVANIFNQVISKELDGGRNLTPAFTYCDSIAHRLLNIFADIFLTFFYTRVVACEKLIIRQQIKDD